MLSIDVSSGAVWIRPPYNTKDRGRDHIFYGVHLWPIRVVEEKKI